MTTYFLKDVAVSGFGSLSETDPGATTMNTGWVVAKLAAANFSKLLYGTERASTAFSTTDALTTATAPAGGDSWRSENTINGIFANANWTLTFRVRAVTAASAQTGRVKVRIWRAANAAGTGATQITSGMLTGTTTAALSTTVDATSTVTFTPGATVTLTNEYLFVQCEWETVAVSGSNSGDVDFRASASTVVTSTFTPGAQTLTQASTYSNPAPSFAAASLAHGLTQAALYDNPESLYAPAVTSAVALTVDAILDNAQTFNDHTVVGGLPPEQTLTLSLYTDADSFYAPALTQGLTQASTYNNAPSFAVPVLAYGLTQASRYNNPLPVFAAPSLTCGLTQATLYSNPAPSFAAPVVTASVSLSPPLYSNSQSFYAPARGGSNTLAPALYSNGQSFLPPAAASTKTLAPPLFVNTQNFLLGDPYFFLPLTIAFSFPAQSLAPPLYSDPDSFPAAAIGHGLTAALYSDPDGFPAANVAAGAVILYPLPYLDPDVFFDVQMTGGIPAGRYGRFHPFLDNVGQIWERT